MSDVNNKNNVGISETSKSKKNIFHIFFTSFLLLLVCVGVGFSSYFIYQAFKPEMVNHDTTQQHNFIRERTMSIRFDSHQSPNGYEQMFGTTWIIGQDSVNKKKFYMATNMHVIAGAITTSNNNLTSPTNINSTYSINKDYINSVTLSFPDPKNMHVVNTNQNDLIEETFTSTFLPTVDYVATSYSTPTNSGIASPYSMSDLAILGFDSSSSTQDFKDFLNFNYLKSPTRFALNLQGPLRTNDYFIGGYPFDNLHKKGVWKFENSYNNSKEKVSAISKITPNFSKGNSKILSKKYEDAMVYGSDIGIIFPYYINYAQTKIPAIQYENYAFQNISEQIIISNLNLGPGSSGSMTINKDNEVVGIYWGVYIGVNKNYGAFDCFISNTLGYNLLKDIKSTIKTISNGNWDQV